jgi:hypothetical protein
MRLALQEVWACGLPRAFRAQRAARTPRMHGMRCGSPVSKTLEHFACRRHSRGYWKSTAHLSRMLSLSNGLVMACPFFMPTERLHEGAWLHPSRLPLGAGWNGTCCAPGHEHANLSVEMLQEFCNMGYAAACPHLPEEREYDSVRFAVAQDRGERVVVWYSCERAHRPAAQGKLEYNVAMEAWVVPHLDSRLQIMADCYLQSYLLRRIQPASPGVNPGTY